MAKFEDRENRRRGSIVGSIVDGAPAVAGSGRGRPKEDRYFLYFHHFLLPFMCRTILNIHQEPHANS